jgi:hypothetical protein
VEHGRVRGIQLIGSIDPTRRDHVDRQRPVEQRANLHGAGVRAKQQVRVDRIDEERVLHGACRVVLVEVHRVEVEPLVLELRSLRDLPAHGDEDVGHLLGEEAERMARPGPPASGDGRDIHGLARESRGFFDRDELDLACGNGGIDPSAGLADDLAERGLLVVRHIPKRAIHSRERGRLTRKLRARRPQFGRIICRCDCLERRRDGGLGRRLCDEGGF